MKVVTYPWPRTDVANPKAAKIALLRGDIIAVYVSEGKAICIIHGFRKNPQLFIFANH